VEPRLHDDVADLAFLLGRWTGRGEGVWPPGDPFRYGEEMTFEHVGDAFLLYSQRSWSLADGSPIHLERGFLRPGSEGRVELTLAHPLGLVEVAEGVRTATTIDLTATAIGRTATGSDVTGLRRRIGVDGNVLRYELWMTMGGGEETRHLGAALERVDAV
jgi:hypothetical protein